MTEEVAAARRIDAEVQQRASGIGLDVEIAGAEVLLPGRQILERQLPRQPRPRRRSGQRDAPGELSFRHRLPAGQLRRARDGQAGNLQRQRDRAIEQRRDRVRIVAPGRHLDQLRARKRGAGIQPRHHVALRLRADRQLDLIDDVQLSLETEPVQPPDGHVLARAVQMELRFCRRPAQPRAQAEDARAPLGKQARSRQPLELEPGDRDLGGEGALDRAAQVALLFHRPLQIERRLRGEAERRRAAQRDAAVERRFAPFQEHARLRVDVLDPVGADVLDVERECRPRRAGAAAAAWSVSRCRPASPDRPARAGLRAAQGPMRACRRASPAERRRSSRNGARPAKRSSRRS